MSWKQDEVKRYLRDGNQQFGLVFDEGSERKMFRIISRLLTWVAGEY